MLIKLINLALRLDPVNFLTVKVTWIDIRYEYEFSLVSNVVFDAISLWR